MVLMYLSIEEETFSSIKLIDGQNSFFVFMEKLVFTREVEAVVGFLCHSLGGVKRAVKAVDSSPCREWIKKRRRRICLIKSVRAAARIVRARALVNSRS